jgi:putative restriction endonuclease
LRHRCPSPLDAAHIRPDEEPNGLALSVLHHQLLDLGAFTLAKDGRVPVSEQAHGTGGFEEARRSQSAE